MNSFQKRTTALSVRLIFLLLALVSISGCSKDELLTGYATVVDTGSFSSGGCEWAVVFIDGYYQPRNLPPDFQVDGLNVFVTYRIVQNTADCPNAQNYKGRIHINRIK